MILGFIKDLDFVLLFNTPQQVLEKHMYQTIWQI